VASDPLDILADRLQCPVCGGSLRRDERRLLCPAGHAFDIARQGYANLVSGRRRHRGDDARMVAARQRFLDAGHYRPLSSVLAGLAAAHAPARDGIVVDLAGGTGYHLSAVLDACPGRHGLCVDASTAALRRAARAHPRTAAIGADVWGPLPVRSGAASVVLSVFGPRGVAEVERVLGPGGIVVVATPLPGHLRELGRLVGGIGIDPRKPERLAASFRRFERVALQQVTGRIALGREEVHAVMAMGPSARHLSDDQLGRAIARLPGRTDVTVAVEVSVHRSHRRRSTAGSAGEGEQHHQAQRGHDERERLHAGEEPGGGGEEADADGGDAHLEVDDHVEGGERLGVAAGGRRLVDRGQAAEEREAVAGACDHGRGQEQRRRGQAACGGEQHEPR
jgi:23S rRNA (guanine745-N1)-methyltransferase